jgi:predicted ATPase/DNA-binding CsgD family transcriptional regulator
VRRLRRRASRDLIGGPRCAYQYRHDHLPGRFPGSRNLGPPSLYRWSHSPPCAPYDLAQHLAPVHTVAMEPPAPLSRLPSPPTRFIGRQDTITTLLEGLARDHLVTIVGPGGCGKTRVALEVGLRASGGFHDGAFFVDLSGISDRRLVPGTVSQALGLPQPPTGTSAEVLARQLVEREILLLLDNCEHLVDACSQLVETLVNGCPRLRLIATSREPLQVSGEAVMAIEGLKLSGQTSTESASREELSEAAVLFIDRARRARADFFTSDSDQIVIAEICARLDGIPLALELAGARANMMSVQAIAEGLSDRFALLSGKSRSGPPRHKSLLASIEWSWGLLNDEEQSVLRRLSVFAAGFTLPAAEAICSGNGVERQQVLGLLTSLVDKSLVHAQPSVDRFRLHETMRAYSSSALEERGEVAAIRDRHLDYFSTLAVAIKPSTWSEQNSAALRVFETDSDNFRAALDWSVNSKQFNAGAEAMGALAHFFYQLGLRSEALERCGRLLQGELEDLKRADIQYWASLYAWHLDPATSERLAAAVTALGHALGDDLTLARGLIAVARLQMLTDPESCIKTLDEALPLALRTGQGNLVVVGYCFKASALMSCGQPAEALAASEEALRAGKELGWPWGSTFARCGVAQAAVRLGSMDRALTEASIVSEAATAPSDPLFTVLSELVRGMVFMYRGQAGAGEAFDRAAVVAEASFDWANLAGVKTCQGHLEARYGNLDKAYRMLEKAEAEAAFLTGRPNPTTNALLADVAVWRTDMNAARRHVGVCVGQRRAEVGPGAVASLRAAARIARSDGDPLASLGLATTGLEAAFNAGARLEAVELLELCGIAFSDRGRALEAARLLGAAAAQRQSIGYLRGAPAEKELSLVTARLEATLGLSEFEGAFTAGGALSFAEAVNYARRRRGHRDRPVLGWASLSPAERAVALLVGERLTNREIAARLVVSTATVKTHLTRVFIKLGVANRHELAMVAVQQARHENPSEPIRPSTSAQPVA